MVIGDWYLVIAEKKCLYRGWVRLGADARGSPRKKVEAKSEETRTIEETTLGGLSRDIVTADPG